MTTTNAFASAWPASVTDRYLTLAGQSLADPHITVDIHDLGNDAVKAVCRGCRNSRYSSAVDQWALESAADRWAREHAEACRALPRPETGER